MKIKQYDRVLLTDGNEASIVEIFEEDKLFLADIDKDGDTYTEEVSADEIKEIIHMTTHKRVDGKTPIGGDYSEIFYFDKNRNLTDEKSATSFVIRECLSNGELICETWGNTSSVNVNDKTALTESAIKFIISRVIDNARDAAEEAKQNGKDDFYKGRKLAYYEILDTIKNELIVREADLKEFGLDIDLENEFI